MTKEQLIAFSNRVAEAFAAKRIPAPVHLCSDSQAAELVQIFQDIRPQDWVFSTWRSSFHALLKGISEEWVFEEILAGRSMYLMNREHNFMASSIVGGMLPIAAGVATGLKRNKRPLYDKPPQWQLISHEVHPSGYKGTVRRIGEPDPVVWVFVGDMCATTGLFHEFRRYCEGQDLPIRVVIEDNGLSTDTPTEEAWGVPVDGRGLNTQSYTYERNWPHVGIGRRIDF